MLNKCYKCGADALGKIPVEAPTMMKCHSCGLEWNLEDHVDFVTWIIQSINEIKGELGI
jgi:hypothetical protein